jgi:tetratricopeptide (TPR) repeat protein
MMRTEKLIKRMAAGLCVIISLNAPAITTNTPPPASLTTARDFYNAGTLKLTEGKLAEAEALLKKALAAFDESGQPGALYNLGHVRFSQGKEELKKCQPSKSIIARNEAVGESALQAMQAAQAALAGNDMQKLIEAYVSARGVRKEARATIEAFNKAIEAHAATLRKWHRSLGDFKSTTQLNPTDTNATHNVKAVEEAIARLIESVRKMQQAMMPMPGNCNGLKDMLSQLKGRIPKEMMPPGAAGDEEEEEVPMLSLRGEMEGPSKEGTEMELSLSPDEAESLLEGLRLEEKRGLPSAKGTEGKPQSRSGLNW